MKKKTKQILLWLFTACVLVFAGLLLSFPNSSRLVLCLVTGTLPDSSHVSRIRSDLQGQKGFIAMLVKHEQLTLQRFYESGNSFSVKKYIHKTPTSMFDIHAFHDYWEVWVRTDIVNGKPLTAYLVRLGMVKDVNAETFFRDQCGDNVCKWVMPAMIGVYNRMFDWGIFKPVRLNITELDETSSVSRKRLDLQEWKKQVGKMHGNGRGVSFMNFPA